MTYRYNSPQVRKFLGSFRFRKFLRCASLQIANSHIFNDYSTNSQISTKYYTTLSNKSPKIVFVNAFLCTISIRAYVHGLTNYIDTKTKCRHLKKLNFKGTQRHIFIRVYRLEIHLVMLVFSTQLCKLQPNSQILTGDKVNSGIGLSNRPHLLMQPGGPVRQPYAGVDFIPSQDLLPLSPALMLPLPPSLCQSRYRQCLAGRGG